MEVARQVIRGRDESDVTAKTLALKFTPIARRHVREALNSVSEALAGLRDLFGAQADVVEVEQEVLRAVASEM